MEAQGTLPELYRIMEGLEYLHKSQVKWRNAIDCHGLSVILGSNLQHLARNGKLLPHVLQPNPLYISDDGSFAVFSIFFHQPAPVLQPWPQSRVDSLTVQNRLKPWVGREPHGRFGRKSAWHMVYLAIFLREDFTSTLRLDSCSVRQISGHFMSSDAR